MTYLSALVDPTLDPEFLVCRNCGASAIDGAPLSGCTENRAEGPGQEHDYRLPASRPFIDKTFSQLVQLLSYYVLKSAGSIATYRAFAELTSDAGDYSRLLYYEKARKRLRMVELIRLELAYRLAKEDLT